MPSLRQIALAVKNDDRFSDTVSHEKVSAMLHGTGVPRWSKLQPVVETLATMSTPPRAAGHTTQRFKVLWDAASATQPAASLPSPASVAARLRYAFVLGGVTGETKSPDFEGVILAQACERLGVAVAAAGVDLVVCSPFPDSADFYALSGYLESGVGGTVHMHMPRHEAVESQFRQLQEVLGRNASDRIKLWHYPGPEKADREAMGQAWVLCQLMAMEQAEVVIAVGGKPDKTASTILHLAQVRQKPVVPFAFLGGAAERVFRRRDWAAVYPWLDTRSLQDKNAVGDVMAIADKMMTARVRDWSSLPEKPRAVFISRARVDIEYSRGLHHYLTELGLRVLFGEGEVPSDRTVEAAIEDAVLRADLFIVLWSRAYAASRYCYDEIDLALKRYNAGELRLWIINLDGSDVVPPGARTLYSVAARTPDEVVAVARELLADTRQMTD
jgi:hypothetical protein